MTAAEVEAEIAAARSALQLALGDGFQILVIAHSETLGLAKYASFGFVAGAVSQFLHAAAHAFEDGKGTSKVTVQS